MSNEQTGNGSGVEASRPEEEMKIAHEVSEVIGHMLGDGLSMIDPTTTIWTASAAEDLRARIGDNPIVGTGQGQWDKLDKQLAGATREVVLLAAELVFLREHPLGSALPETRRAHVERVLQHLDSADEIPASMATWLSRPSGTAGFEPGQAYNGGLWRHVVWVSTFIRYWNGLDESERAKARNDPWILQRVMLASGDDRSDIRNALQFLARPDVFEPISSASMKERIRDGLADRIGRATGNDAPSVDRDLLAIRSALASEFETPFHFWTPGIRELWDATPEPTDEATESASQPEPRPRHYWLYSPGAQASEREEFSANDIMAIDWDELDDLAAYSSREAIRQALDPDGTGGSMKNAVLACRHHRLSRLHRATRSPRYRRGRARNARPAHADPRVRQGRIPQRGLPVRGTIRPTGGPLGTEKECHPRRTARCWEDIRGQAPGLLDDGRQGSQPGPDGAVPSELLL